MKFNPATPPRGTVRDWLNERGNDYRSAFVFPETGETLTWAELKSHAEQVAGDLTAQGVAKGESVIVMHPNGLEGIRALFAVLYGGFRVTMLNLAAGPDALAYAMKHSKARLAFVHDDQITTFDKVRPDALELYRPSDEAVPLHDITTDDDALLMYWAKLLL